MGQYLYIQPIVKIKRSKEERQKLIELKDQAKQMPDLIPDGLMDVVTKQKGLIPNERKKDIIYSNIDYRFLDGYDDENTDYRYMFCLNSKRYSSIFIDVISQYYGLDSIGYMNISRNDLSEIMEMFSKHEDLKDEGDKELVTLYLTRFKDFIANTLQDLTNQDINLDNDENIMTFNVRLI